MTLNFPNVSRSFEAARQSVCFWGYDSAFEISFYVGVDVLRLISSRSPPDEAALLQVFDTNRVRIEQIASKAYSRRRQSHYHLLASDF